MIFLIVFVFILIFGILIIYFATKKRKKITKQEYQKHKVQIMHTRNLDPEHSILKAHKIFVTACSQFSREKTAAKIIEKVVNSAVPIL